MRQFNFKSTMLPIAAALAVVVATGSQAQTASAVTIPMVTVGNPGNAPDTRYHGYQGVFVGSVGYEYKIGKYEITAGQYTEFLNAVAKSDPTGLYNVKMAIPASGTWGANIQRAGFAPNFSYSVAPDWANRPVNYVSFWDAVRFVNWLDNGQPTGPQGPGTTEGGAYHNVGNETFFGRNAGAKFFIPTEDEWYKAAYHDKTAGLAASYFDFPTSSNQTPINTLPDTGNHANFDFYGGNADGGAIGSPYYRTNVGEFVNSPSPYGTFDQGGNVWEWDEKIIGGVNRGERGGAYAFDSTTLLASTFTYYLVPENEIFYLGFRVASAIPEPVSLTLCVMGAVSLMTWRRTRQYCRTP